MIYRDIKQRVENVLRATPYPMTKSDIARHVGIPIYWVTKVLKDIGARPIRITSFINGYMIR